MLPISFENWVRSQAGAYYKSFEVNETVSATSTTELTAAEYEFTVASDHSWHIPIWHRVILYTPAPTNLALSMKEQRESSVVFEIRQADSGPFDTGLVHGIVEAVFLPVSDFNATE